MQHVDRFKLLFGPYQTPRCKIGGWLTCSVRGRVKVHGITDAPIPWPFTFRDNAGGHRMLIVCGGLMRAIERESSLAVRHWFGVSLSTVWKWRKALGVERNNHGTRELQRRLAYETVQADKAIRKRLTKDGRRKMSEGQRRRVRPPRGSSFDLAFVALLGTMTDREVAKRTGLTEAAVVSRRRVLKIAAFKK